MRTPRRQSLDTNLHEPRQVEHRRERRHPGLDTSPAAATRRRISVAAGGEPAQASSIVRRTSRRQND
jgi:hypothetical protein